MPAQTSEKKTQTLTLVLSPSELEEVEDFRFGHRIQSRSEAVRQLLRLGLDAARSQLRGERSPGTR